MQSRTRSMSIPFAGDGTPSRWSCALKSSEASSGINPPLDPAHETARVENPVWIKGLLEGAHDRKAGRRRSPDVEGLLEGDRGGGHHHLSLGAGSQAQPRQCLGGTRRRTPNIDNARGGLGNDATVRRNRRHQRLAGGERNDGAEHHPVVHGRGPVSGGVPEGRRGLRFFHRASAIAEESNGLIPGRRDLAGVTIVLEDQGPSAPTPTPTLPRERGRGEFGEGVSGEGGGRRRGRK